VRASTARAEAERHRRHQPRHERHRVRRHARAEDGSARFRPRLR
jgi:hypothetical protein